MSVSFQFAPSRTALTPFRKSEGVEADVLELVCQMLNLSEHERITAEEALESAFLQEPITPDELSLSSNESGDRLDLSDG